MFGWFAPFGRKYSIGALIAWAASWWVRRQTTLPNSVGLDGLSGAMTGFLSGKDRLENSRFGMKRIPPLMYFSSMAGDAKVQDLSAKVQCIFEADQQHGDC